MPIYEYRCASCGQDFEQTRPVAQSSDPAPCPTCQKPAQKLISSFASKVDYTVKVPTKGPFRAPVEAPPAPAAPSRAASKSSRKARPAGA